MRTTFPFGCCCLLAVLAPVIFAAPSWTQKEHGFDNTKPSGQPYLSPDESVRRMKVPDGWEVKLFAAEPMVVNPIAFTIDERGRVWVVECFEYPSRTLPGQMPRDRIVILEDTNGDGTADQRTVFAEGKDFPVRFDLASGMEIGYDGCYLGAPPYLWHLKDTNGDGKADKFDVLLKGFGSQDTHETLNTFTWGPDGWLYGLHGIFTHSKVQTAGESAAGTPGPVAAEMNAGVWRYHPKTKKFEIFAEGTSNPWGMDFDSQGNCFVCCCVIPHLFHIAPGGIYKRQAGHSLNPYAYGELSEICDHTFHKESGWAHAGLLCLDNDNVPPEFRTSVIFGSIHGTSLKRNVLERRGSTFVARKAPDFLTSGDKNFRPIGLRWGPAGDIYVSDWHDQNPCHQAKAESWDYERGRIYRIARRGRPAKSAHDWSRSPVEMLLAGLDDADVYTRRICRNLLLEDPQRFAAQHVAVKEKVFQDFSVPALPVYHAYDQDVRQALMNGAGLNYLLKNAVASAFRAWLIRLYAQSPLLKPEHLAVFVEHARSEPAAEVRRELASALLRWGHRFDTRPLLHALLGHQDDSGDPVIAFLLWLAYVRPLVADYRSELEWIGRHAPANRLVANHVVSRAMRRLLATGKEELLAACVTFVGEVKDSAVRRQALRGLHEGLNGKLHQAPPVWEGVFTELQRDSDAEVQRLAQSLAVYFGDAQAAQRAYGIAHDLRKTSAERAEAVRGVVLAKHPHALALCVSMVQQNGDLTVRLEAARCLASFDAPNLAGDIIRAWKQFPPPVRTELVNVLKGRKPWAKALLDAVGREEVPRTDLTDNTILAIRSFKDDQLNALIERVWGRYRATPAELEALIVKMRKEVETGPADAARGKLVFQKNCQSCHRFEGQGHHVGPKLDGADRGVEYLLVNILDPNRVVGQPYYTRVMELKSGQVLTGVVVAEDPQSVTLKRENESTEIVQRTEIEQMVTTEKSLMPEGLGYNMTTQEFRDLIQYLRKDRTR